MMKKIIILSFLYWILFCNNLFSQSKIELRNTFYDAESWFLYEDYKEALPLYLTLLRIYPQNSNFKYRIGRCYLNTPGEKEKAISYLDQAAKKINPNYKKGKFSETGAPYDALFYLANAYLINNKLDKAIETFNLFYKNLDPRVYDTAVVKLQIKACINAQGMISRPVYLKETNLGSSINQKNSEYNPVVSDDESMLVFTRSYPFYDALLYSVRDASGRWSEPLNMNEVLKVDNYFYPTSISHDGKDLYLYSSVDYDGIIYTTRYENGKWSPLVKLNDHINTKYWESHATISHDNKKLYFTSNRKGTYGGLDIYVSTRDSSGNWGVAKNLGPAINTPYNEESPFLSQDDKTLYFSSRGHFGMGGYDYFYSTILENGQWSVPLNVGYPMNTTDDDVFFKPINDGYEGYIAKYNSKGFGKQDIYKIEIFSDEHPRKFLVKGIAKMPYTTIARNEPIQIIAIKTVDPGKTVTAMADPKTGEFKLSLPFGNYEFSYKTPGNETVKNKVAIPISNPSDTFNLPVTVLTRPGHRAILSVIGSKYRTVTKPDPVIFQLKVEPNSMLNIRRWNGKRSLPARQFS
jgi:tetratricopeptide (TPR) repeat protein